MKVKRIIVLLVCLALLLCSTAACGGGGTSSSEQSSSSSSSSSAVSEESEASSQEESSEAASSSEVSSGTSTGLTFNDPCLEGKDFSEKMTIELASVQIEEGRDYNAGDAWVKSWADKFNIEWDIVPLTFENWQERLQIWINSDDMPEMCVYNYVHGDASNYASQGLVKKLPDDWKEKYPNLAKSNSDSPMSQMAEEAFGGTYFLFRPIYSNNRPTEKLATHNSAYLRKDWGEAAGAEVSDVMTLDQFYDYARKVKDANPGNVENFYPIRATTGYLTFLVQANNTYSGVNGLPFYKGDDGVYHWGGADESTFEALKMLNTAYNDGLIDPEFYTIQEPDDGGAFYTTGETAALIHTCMINDLQDFDSHMKNDLGVNFEDAVQIVTVTDNEGNFHGMPLTNYWGTNIFSPHIDDAKLDRILTMMDYSCTDEGQLQIRLGIQGVDWDYDENNEIVSYIEEGDDLWDKYALLPIYVNMMVLSDDFQFLNPSYKQSLRDQVKHVHEMHQEHSTDESFPLEPDWNVVLHDSRALNLASMSYGEEYASLIIKEGDIEENWKAWVDEKMPLIQPVLDELNAKVAE